MSELQAFLDETGGLHDARVQEMIWSVSEKAYRLQFVDIYRNFYGLPGYKGPKPGFILLNSVMKIEIDVQVDLTIDTLNVYEISQKETESKFIQITMKFWPKGSIIVTCAEVSVGIGVS